MKKNSSVTFLKIFSFCLFITFFVSCKEEATIDDINLGTSSEVEEEAEEEEAEEEVKTYEDISEEDSNITWKNWYLSVPIDRADGSGKATSISYIDIEADDLTVEEREYFDFNDDGSFKMNTKFTGYTTSGEYDSFTSKYCRTELREYWAGVQSTDDNWYFDDEVHVLQTTLSVEKCEGEGKAYIAQIHGKSGADIDGVTLSKSPATVKVAWEDGEIELEYYTTEGVDTDGEWTSSDGVEKVVLGEVNNNKFTVNIKVDNGVLYLALACDETGVDTGYVKYYDYATAGYTYQNYFKTGNYFRHDEDYTSESHVTLYSAYTYHSELED